MLLVVGVVLGLGRNKMIELNRLGFAEIAITFIKHLYNKLYQDQEVLISEEKLDRWLEQIAKERNEYYIKDIKTALVDFKQGRC